MLLCGARSSGRAQIKMIIGMEGVECAISVKEMIRIGLSFAPNAILSDIALPVLRPGIVKSRPEFSMMPHAFLSITNFLLT